MNKPSYYWKKCILAKYHNRKTIQTLIDAGWIPTVFGPINKINQVVEWMKTDQTIEKDSWITICGTRNSCLLLIKNKEVQLYLSMVWKGQQ